MFTLYSSKDRIEFEFEEQHKTLPESIQALGKWIGIRAMRIDPWLAKEEKWPETIKEHWYIFKGSNNISGRLVGSVTIEVKRFK